MKKSTLLMLGCIMFGITGTSHAVAQDYPEGYCPYDLRGSGLSAEEIAAICEEWRREQPTQPGPRTGDGEQFPGQNCYGRCDAQPY